MYGGSVTEQWLLILAGLAHGELHGYGIARDVEELSDGRVKLTAGTLYGALNRMVDEGWVAPSGDQVVGGRRRRYYRITAAGEAALAAEVDRMRSTAAAVGARLVGARAAEAGMRRRVLALCVLAYPRSRRERDGDYLRDLALELAEGHGVRREVASLLRHGLVERVRFSRRRLGAPRRRRQLVASLISARLAAGVWVWPAVEQRIEAEQFTCATTDGCAETAAKVAARVRDGWACWSSQDTREGLTIMWQCTFGSARESRVERLVGSVATRSRIAGSGVTLAVCLALIGPAGRAARRTERRPARRPARQPARRPARSPARRRSSGYWRPSCPTARAGRWSRHSTARGWSAGAGAWPTVRPRSQRTATRPTTSCP